MRAKEKAQYLQRVCGKTGVLLYNDSGDHKRFAYLKIRCNSWLCPGCRNRKADDLSKRALEYFSQEKTSLLTLTMPGTATVDTSFKDISSCWNRFRTKLTRYYGKIKYLAVVEPQPKRGCAHLHVIVNKYLPWAFLDVNIPRSGFGKIWDIEFIPNKRVFGYVLKYLRKDWTNEEALDAAVKYRVRRFRSSRGFPSRNASRNFWRLLCPALPYDQARSIYREVIHAVAEHYGIEADVKDPESMEITLITIGKSIDSVTRGDPWELFWITLNRVSVGLPA